MAERRVMEIALRYLARQDYTGPNLAEKLLKAGFEPEEVAQCIQHIRNWGYINDCQFAIVRIKKLQAKYKSRFYIEGYLLESGLKPEMVSELLAELYPEKLEVEIAGELLRRKFSKKEYSPVKQWQFLIRAGFSENTVSQCFADISTT
jgi:SOS response regulatory protein OraA/RecX